MPASATPAGPAAAASAATTTANNQGARPETGERKPESQNQGENRESRIENRESTDPTAVSNEDLAEHLNLPAGVRASLQKTEERKPESGEEEEGESGKQERRKVTAKPAAEEEGEEESSSEESEGEGSEEERQQPASEEEGAEADHDHEHEHEDDDEEEPLPRDVKKLQKRVHRLTKKSRQQERELAAFRAQGGEQGGRSADAQEAAAAAVYAAPQTGGILGKARTERDLDGMVNYFESVIDLADNNPDGVTTGEGADAKFHPPQELAKWRRDAEKGLLGSERRRREIREHAAQRQTYNTQARRDFPELMKEGTKEFQTAVNLAGRYPWIAQLPEANYALGLMVEGFKALNNRAGKGKNGNGSSTSRSTSTITNGAEGDDDLDERLTPEYQRDHIPPTAPVTPRAPNRSSNGAAAPRLFKKVVEDTAAKASRPGGFTTTNLADALSALDEEEEAPSKRRVAV